MGWQMVEAGALLIDVRTENEFNGGHLFGAKNIPHDEIADRIKEIGNDRNRAIVLYCRSGNRSERARTALIGQGFNNVFNAGGYDAMKAAQ